MRRALEPTQTDLFSPPTIILPLSLTTTMREELVSFLSALLLEVISYPQGIPTQQESAHEQQDHT